MKGDFFTVFLRAGTRSTFLPLTVIVSSIYIIVINSIDIITFLLMFSTAYKKKVNDMTTVIKISGLDLNRGSFSLTKLSAHSCFHKG